ncbi:MAG: thioredoxin domain-containing protein [Byssovorax sp.]
MLKSFLRKASIATLLGVVACAAQPPAPSIAPSPAPPPSPPVAQAAKGGAAADGEGAQGMAEAGFGSGAPAGAPAAEAMRTGARGGVPGGAIGGAMGGADQGPVPVTVADPSWGNANAPVTLVEFSDFQCPFCGRLNSTLDQLRQTYGPTKLRIVWKNNPLPFHNNARPAAEVAMALYEKGGASWFWQFHNAVFTKGLNAPEVIIESYKFTGLSEAQVNALVGRGSAARKVDEDMDLGRRTGVQGTPASFINGVFLSGAQPYDKFSAIIDEQLVAANQLVGKGVPLSQIYARLSAENKLKAPPAPPASPAHPADDDKSVWRVPVGTSPVRGNAAAPVTMIMFSDYQCPFCVRAATTVAALATDYGDKLRVVYKHNPLPFHPRAEPSAQLALEARAQKGDAGFWKVNDLLWARSGKLEDQELEGIAVAAGLNVAAATKAMATHKYKAIIEQDQDLADEVSASGTPHFFINGVRLVGAQPVEKFKEVIDAQLAIAKAEIAKGTPAAKVYDALQKDAKTPPPPEKKTIAAPTKDSPSRGPATAKVTVQIIADFQCPFCKRANPTLTELDAAFPGKLRFVWRNKPLPMHANAPLAAEAAMEAFAQKGSAGFWKMHDLMFANLGEQPDALERPSLERYAAAVGLDPAKFAASLDGHTHKAFVDSESKMADDAGITGTPGFLINGYFLSGAQPLGRFKKLVERALKEAR